MTPPQVATTAAAPTAALARFKLPWAKTPIVEIKIVSLKFLSDHHVMQDNNSDWKNTGSLFSKPEWVYGKASAPVSNTKNSPVSVELEIDVFPTDADEVTGCTIKGDAGFASLVFSCTQNLKGGKFTGINAKTAGKLADAVNKLTGDIKWSVDVPGQGTLAAGASWGHIIYVTIDTPISAPVREAGITQKRMDKAVELISPFHSNDPHTIVQKLMQLIPYYWLNNTPPASYTGPTPGANLDYPRYLSRDAPTLGGAWLIADFLGAYAECQAIVRFVRAVTKQVGCPGDARVMLVFADPDFNNGNDVKEQDYELPRDHQADSSINGMLGYGLNNHTQKVINGMSCGPALLAPQPTVNVKEGYTFDMNQVDEKWIGLNNYEACLKFTYPDPPSSASVAKYYGGGAAITNTKEEMIKAFHSLAWVSFLPSRPGKQMVKIVKMIKKF